MKKKFPKKTALRQFILSGGKLLMIVLYFLFIFTCFTASYFEITDKFLNPYLLLLWSFLIGIVYILILVYTKNKEKIADNVVMRIEKKIGGAFFGILSIFLCFFTFNDVIKEYPEPVKYSDVIPQLEAQYDWFATGEFPYQKLKLELHAPYPVYMPLHWMPIGISRTLNIDTRWSGFLILLLIAGLTGWLLIGKNSIGYFLSFLLLGAPLIAFLWLGKIEIPVSYELIIAAYYLLLGVGLKSKSNILVLLGVTCCILSRYTLVFWLPLFFILFLKYESWQKSVFLWGGAGTLILLIYVMPFLSKDPSILSKGLTYHNNAAASEWKGYKETGISYTMERGIYFGGNMKRAFSGAWPERVYKARIVQAVIMLFLFLSGLILFYKLKDKIYYQDFSLVMLYFTLIFFYYFGPLTYQYYLLVPMMLAALLCIDVLNSDFTFKEER